jgi:amino acid adenylation domain-containing protein
LLDQRPYIEQPINSAYRDFVALERTLLESEDQGRFWEERLRDSTVMTLPRWSTESSEVGRKLRRLHVPISLPLSEKLKDVSVRGGVPVKSVLLAAHFKVMSVLAGQDDILTGMVTHGRSTLQDGDLVLGLFLNSMPFRKRLGNGNWLELAQELLADEQELEPFQTYPLAEIQRRCGGRPLFETLFNFSHFHVFNKLIGNEQIEFLGVDSFEETNFTLLVNFTTDLLPAKIRLDLSYDANVLSDEQVEAIGGYYASTLEAIAGDPTAGYAMFSPLSRAERELLLRGWNDTGSGPTSDNCLHQLFEAQVKQSPEQLALVFADEQLTYRELNRRANQMARYLQMLGVQTESAVGIYLERSVEMAIAVLAVLKAGGVYIPVDPEYPQERIAYIFSDAQMRVLLTQESLLPKLPDSAVQVVCVDSEKEQIARQADDNLNSLVFLDNLAYITYTSGSTGQPKGVAVPQRLLTNLIEWHLRDLNGGIRMLQFAPLGFDLSFYEMFVTWLSAGTLYLMREELRRDVPALAGFLLKHRIQKVVFPVVLLQQLAEECEAQEIVLPDLIEVISSGEQLQISRAIIEFFEKLPASKLHNHYGPSETHAATAYELGSEPRTWRAHPSIGRPITGMHVYLLDHYLNPVPVGVAGELYLSTNLARGYLNRPDLTAEKFVPHPFAETNGERLYRTGDLARYATDGNIDFLGRMDHQIKIRGYRIELGEIEAVLAQHSDIREVVVRAETPRAGGEKSLIAFVVPERGNESAQSLSAVDLRSFLNNKLPDYMVPSTFVILESLPLTPNNKIDYRALASIEYSRSESASIFTPPSTPTEEIIAGIWSEVLGLERLGIHDDFFELGGHSLKATQIASRVRSAFQIELPVHRIFECNTVAKLSVSLDAAGTAEAPVLNTSPRRIEEKGAMFPLSFAQQRLWFLSQLKSNSAFYNVAGAIRLEGSLDVAALERSLSEVGRRHAVLRTTFRLVEGTPMQVISPDSNLVLPVTDLSELPPAEREVEIQRLATNEAKKLFDLANGPLLRVSLLRCSSEDHILLMTFHHIVSDGWSRGVLIRELTALYQAFSRGEESKLPELPLQYADFAVWQREWLQGNVLQRQLDYWKEVLEGAPSVVRLPADRPRPAVQTFRSAKLSIKLPENLANALRRLSRREGVTLFMTLLAAFETLLYRYSGETDLVIGTTIANRRWAEIEGLIGFFSNSLVLRTDLSGNPSFRELLKRVRRVSLDAYAHQDLPFERLVEELKIERTLSHTPLFQVVFSFQNSPPPEVKLPDLVVSPMEMNTGAAMFDLILGMVDEGVELTGVLHYSTDLFETATAAKLLDDFTLLLEAVAAHPDRSLLDFEIDPAKVDAPPLATLPTASYEVEQFDF